MKKGITPIISIIILLLITVALAGAAWTFLQGFIYPQITKSFLIPSGGSFCAGKNITVYVINTGYQSTLDSPQDWVLAQVDGNDISLNCASNPNDPACGLLTTSLQQGESKRVVYWDCDPAGNTGQCVSGYHTVDLGTVSAVQHLSVFCP